MERPPLQTGWGAIDRAIGGLARGVVHEWIGTGFEVQAALESNLELGARPNPQAKSGSRSSGAPPPGGEIGWFAPLRILLHLAACSQRGPDARGLVVWIGSCCFAYPVAMLSRGQDVHGNDGEPADWPARSSDHSSRRPLNTSLLERSLFVPARTVEERTWAIDLALRSRGVDAVIGDVSGTRMPESRRFQLAAAAGGTLALLTRPPWEALELSAAATRWKVTPSISDDQRPRWTLDLLRCKGSRPRAEDARRWVVRDEHETCAVCLVPDAADRDAAKAGSAKLRIA